LRKLALRAVDTVATLIVLPAFLLYRLGGLAMGAERAFPGWSQTMSLIPGFSGVYLRRAFYRLVLTRCDRGVSIGFGTVISHPWAELGRNVYTGAYCSLGDVNLGDDVLLGSHVSVINGGGQHGIDRLDVPIREQPGVFPKITIGRDTWIGERSTVLADVGKHCVIGAGSVVTKPIPDYAIALGTPARILRYRMGAPGVPTSEPDRLGLGRAEQPGDAP